MRENFAPTEAALDVPPAPPGHRAPPVVIVVPPRPDATVPAIMGPVLIAMVVIPLLLAAVFGPAVWRGWLLAAAGLVAAGGTLFVLLTTAMVQKERRRIDEYLAATKHDFSHPAQRELRRLWAGLMSMPPSLPRIRAALDQHGLRAPGRATVLVFDTTEQRAAHPYSFEPVIFTPTQRLGSHVFALLIIAAWAGLALLCRALHMRLPVEPWNLGVTYFLGAVAIWRWYKVGFAAPEYIRLAPGMIQFVRFERGVRKPKIRAYEMCEDTLLVFMRFGAGMSLLISTPSASETIPISEMSQSDAALEAFWQAILSTAPTPPLSDEDLLG